MSINFENSEKYKNKDFNDLLSNSAFFCLIFLRFLHALIFIQYKYIGY